MKWNEEWSSQLCTQLVLSLRKEAGKNSGLNSTGFEPVIPVRCSNQLSYEAIDVESRFEI